VGSQPFGLGVTRATVLEWVKQFAWATAAGAVAADLDVKPLADGPGNPTGKNRNGSNATIPPDRGATYLVRRLKRDAPAVAAALGTARPSGHGG
jgi:hypothetical protein